MTSTQSILMVLILVLPLFLTKHLKDAMSISTYIFGYTLGLFIAVSLIRWFG